MARRKNNPDLILAHISGQLGKQLVVKQYSYGTVVTKYPDMNGVKPSALQHDKHNRFKEAVAYAKGILRDKEKRQAYAAKVPPGKTVYHYAIAEYLKENE